MQLVYGEIGPGGVRGITIPRFHIPELPAFLDLDLELNLGVAGLNWPII